MRVSGAGKGRARVHVRSRGHTGAWHANTRVRTRRARPYRGLPAFNTPGCGSGSAWRYRSFAELCADMKDVTWVPPPRMMAGACSSGSSAISSGEASDEDEQLHSSKRLGRGSSGNTVVSVCAGSVMYTVCGARARIATNCDFAVKASMHLCPGGNFCARTCKLRILFILSRCQ